MLALSKFRSHPSALVAAIAALIFSAPSILAQEVSPNSQTEVFADWTVRCGTYKAGRSCSLQQIQRQSGTSKQVLAIYVRALANEDRMTIVVPLGVFLPAGVDLKIGGELTAQIAFTICRDTGCVAQIPLDEKILAALQSGNAGAAVVRTADGKEIALPISMSGFADAWARLERLADSAN